MSVSGTDLGPIGHCYLPARKEVLPRQVYDPKRFAKTFLIRTKFAI